MKMYMYVCLFCDSEPSFNHVDVDKEKNRNVFTQLLALVKPV